MTQKYEEPQVLSLSNTNEGVYLASGGAGASWNINVSDVQTWNGSGHVFKAECTLNAGTETNVSGMTIQMQFNYPLTGARLDSNSEFVCSYSGNTVTLVSNDSKSCGPGYKVYAQVLVYTGDEATSKALTCTSYSCV